MDTPNIVVCMAVIPWTWILMKLAVFGDLINLMPMAILGYLIYLLDRAIRKRNLDEITAKQDELLKKRDSFSQTVRYEFAETSTQTTNENVDAFTQVEKIQMREVSTQTVQTKIDAFTQMEYKESDVKATQTNRVQTEIFQNSSKVFVPVKKQKPKPNIPLTKEFLKYHQNKHNHQRKKLKFKPKLELIYELDEHENETELSKSPSCEELEIKDSFADESIVEQKFCKTSLKQNGDSSNDDVHFVLEDVTKGKKKEKKASFFKKKFKNLKKLFKK
ncbi:hypothetical protein AVEN_209525-1 [Araneus ventricosus]|uniref:Uncharacterized protein n=1 Tax=Araneus ventricosus TaxID=182803 RepID=A0A4Y1ZNE1_ARAVE|nr:hypothetical protein AVEN_3683-1 [Araneus ventricosus]GBL58910.1 hypothetical protein AVEN_8417-1 [Araneus ventricosus]GBL58959.1 hypothetical protein AVEN_242085-1 [Araneus ventricosus]GBL59263.1 hypothetical protein AVEN_209525-1 [Araneus ventricosus]